MVRPLFRALRIVDPQVSLRGYSLHHRLSFRIHSRIIQEGIGTKAAQLRLVRFEQTLSMARFGVRCAAYGSRERPQTLGAFHTSAASCPCTSGSR